MNIERIESKDNRRLVHARKVRDGRVPDLIFIEGRRLAAEALRSRIVIKECFGTHDLADDDLVKAAAERGAFVASLPDRIFRTIADTDNPQGIILIAQRPVTGVERVIMNLASAEVPLIIFLSHINNPSNLGAVIRTAEAAGCAGVVLSPGSTDPFSSKALRASMGSAFRLPIAEGVAITEACDLGTSKGLVTIATAADADRSYLDVNWKRAAMLIFGSEAHGLTTDELALADNTIRIPMSPTIESLNLGTSAGIILFEARRQITA